ncbi:8832_t:CDS:2, partial [Funneliformis geosporum]
HDLDNTYLANKINAINQTKRSIITLLVSIIDYEPPPDTLIVPDKHVLDKHILKLEDILQNNVSYTPVSRPTHQTIRKSLSRRSQAMLAHMKQTITSRCSVFSSLLTALEANPILRLDINAPLEVKVNVILLSNTENSLEILQGEIE